MERKDLIKNDYFALFKTFDNVYIKFEDKINKDSYFYKLLKDVEQNKDLNELI
jgi:hypothetical protein